MNNCSLQFVGEPHASGTTPFNTTTTCTASVVLCISQHDIMLQKIYPIFIDVVQNLYKFITSSKYEKFSCFDSSRQWCFEFYKEHDWVGATAADAQRDYRLDRAQSITQFYKALGIYNIICESLLSVEMKWISIRQKLGRFSIIIFNIYQIAAAYMEMGIKVDWSKHHKNCMIGGSKIRLFVNIVHSWP